MLSPGILNGDFINFRRHAASSRLDARRPAGSHLEHYLAPLLKPQSVALVGASDQAGSLGRTVFENLLAAAYTGTIYAVNPHHRRMFDRRVYASIAAIGKPIDLAIIAIPAGAVPDVLDDAQARIRTAA